MKIWMKMTQEICDFDYLLKDSFGIIKSIETKESEVNGNSINCIC